MLRSCDLLTSIVLDQWEVLSIRHLEEQGFCLVCLACYLLTCLWSDCPFLHCLPGSCWKCLHQFHHPLCSELSRFDFKVSWRIAIRNLQFDTFLLIYHTRLIICQQPPSATCSSSSLQLRYCDKTHVLISQIQTFASTSWSAVEVGPLFSLVLGSLFSSCQEIPPISISSHLWSPN